VDAVDGALRHGLADVRAAAGQLAVVARTRASDLQARTGLVSGRLACDRRRPPVADVHKPFFGERQECVPYGAEWGGWGSNLRPADYEKCGFLHLCVLAAQMTRIIAPAALTTLGLSGAPVHEPVHARGPSAPSSCYYA
jgi:hypothetical protein